MEPVTEREVSCRVFDVLLGAARRNGIPVESLIEGSSYPLSHLRNKHERVEWTEFVHINANAGRIWSDPELVEIGGAFFRSGVIRTVLMPARILFRPKDVYRWVLSDSKGAGKQFFSCVRDTYKDLGKDGTVLELTLPPGYPRCREFFLITKGAITDLPRALGLQQARVELEEIESGARFRIAYPEERGVASWIRRKTGALFESRRSIAKELKEANEVLQARYQELEDYRLNLERKVEERTKELEATVQRLREAQDARNRLFANINHEIRHPLSHVMLAASEVLDTDGEKISERSSAQLANIDGATRRLLRLVDGLLLLAEGQEDRLRLRVEYCDLVPILRNLVLAWVPHAELRGLSLTYDGPERCQIRVDEHALDRIVTNLLSNALKFTPHGGSVQVRLEEDSADRVELTVRDTGVGVDEEFRSRIFGRFEQGRAPVHPGSQGSGIGLSIVKELCEAHGGTVAVENQERGGTVFHVTLPVDPVIPPERRGVSATESLVRARPEDFGLPAETNTVPEEWKPDRPAAGTVLIAEDDVTLRRTIGEFLGREYRVLAAKDGIAALDLARRHLPDLLVSDVGMAGMDGLELTRRFREIPGNRLAPVVLLSAYGTVRDRLRGFDAGAIDYVTKPFSGVELRARVRSQFAIRSMALKLYESEKLAALGMLSSGLAHELRNPANGIVNAIEPLKALLPPRLLEQNTGVRELFQVLDHCAEQVGHLSRQLLGLRSSGELEKHDELFPDILRRTRAVVGPVLERVEFRNRSGFTGFVSCSAPLIIQVLSNLLENAAHAAADAGQGGWVGFDSRFDAGTLVIQVSDSGPGVAPELRERIFEPFFTTKPLGRGTGLGLTTARDVVNRHGGTLDVRPHGDTTIFHLVLPSAAAGEEPAAAPAPEIAGAARGSASRK